jgi:hypothetical protein
VWWCSGDGEGTPTDLRAAPLLRGSSRPARWRGELVRDFVHGSGGVVTGESAAATLPEGRAAGEGGWREGMATFL